MTDVHRLTLSRRPGGALPAETDLRARAARTLAIFGAGAEGQLAFRSLAREARIVAFADQAEGSWGTVVCGVPVLSPRQLQEAWPDTVVVTGQRPEPLVEQLRALGLPGHRIQIFVPSGDEQAQVEFQTTIDDLQTEVTTLLGLTPETGAPLRVVIFGAGSGGRDAWARCRHHRVVAFADNSPQKIGTSIFGLPVVAPSTLPATPFDRVVVGSMYFDEIRGQLVALGIPADRVCTVEDLTRPASASRGGPL